MPEQRQNILSSAQQDKELPDKNSGKRQKISFYLSIEQVNKLDDLIYEHRKIKGIRLNRNDVIRHLIDQCTIEALANL